jgi:hypothetical protein
MTIPEVAERLREKAAEIGDAELTRLADELRRRRAARKASARSTPMTDELADEIRAYRREHPKVPQALIAIAFGINQGRVSEALHGKRS